jgi:cell wall-associated NlpC family hydrolase
VNAVKRAAFSWGYAAVDGVRFRIPWDINEAEFGQRHYRFAKGTLGEILTFTRTNCPYRTPMEINRWMRGNNPTELHVGIDCSGLVYRVLDEAAALSGAPGLEQTLHSNAYNTSVDGLTDVSVADPLSRAQDVQTGDVIRFNNGGHAGVIFDVSTDPGGRVTEVWFIHSGLSGGPHIAWIEVRDSNEDIGHSSTQWHEVSERPWLADNGLRDSYYQRTCHSRYYLGERGRSIKIPIAVTLNGRPLNFPVGPFAREGVSFAMARPIADGLGADLVWNESEQSAQFYWQGRFLKLQAATTTAWTNSGTITLVAEPELILDRLFMPIKALETGLGVRVTWQSWPPTVRLAT